MVADTLSHLETAYLMPLETVTKRQHLNIVLSLYYATARIEGLSGEFSGAYHYQYSMIEEWRESNKRDDKLASYHFVNSKPRALSDNLLPRSKCTSTMAMELHKASRVLKSTEHPRLFFPPLDRNWTKMAI